MKINLEVTEKIEINYTSCPRCHKPFNMRSRKKTMNHAIPKFMKPLTEVLHTICLECHQELNKYYRHQEIAQRDIKVDSNTFEDFKQEYDRLRTEFYDKKINRGIFGEGLWRNMVSFLGALDKRIQELEGKK